MALGTEQLLDDAMHGSGLGQVVDVDRVLRAVLHRHIHAIGLGNTVE
ncbi:MAG: hypothetical protein L0J68_02765 [Micrococcaceae bacterium]|nr:hypothetical protein [Micrococcaceae bacterium]MDN5812326.1 hypothetical protein [Micrococcaceae bacterium]MDN5823593.1 hypothetical protein [Micrococcaceae bacterium]MDN5878405.1 hypothetical protein [Micrococcaceae bacterium]MDN5905054.1 hypothetical protein [Micrococcaceae bacterium]